MQVGVASKSFRGLRTGALYLRKRVMGWIQLGTSTKLCCGPFFGLVSEFVMLPDSTKKSPRFLFSLRTKKCADLKSTAQYW